MRRREFIALFGGAAVSWPLAARAPQDNPVRRIGMLSNLAQDDKEDQRRVEAFRQTLQELGWTVGRNIQIDYRWGAGKAEFYRKQAAELVALGPDVIVTNGTTTIGPVLETTHTVPVVFVNVSDPVSGGFVESLARPGGNATGFAAAEYGTSGKWLQLLKQIAPEVKRVAVLRDPSTASGSGRLGAIQAVAPLLGVDINAIDVRDAGEIERGLLSSSSNTGVIVTVSGAAITHRDLIITLAAKLKLPAVYSERIFAVSGGLISYGHDAIDQYRRALPVQAPTKFETVINLTTAKALGISMPSSLVVSADEVIE